MSAERPSLTSNAAASPDLPTPRRMVRYEASRDFVPLLEKLGVSLLVSTYQAGKLVVVGTDRGQLTLSFSNFEQPMGLALAPNCLAVGTRGQVWLLPRETEVSRRIADSHSHDDGYCVRRAHFTGQIQIHEMGWGGAEKSQLWLVNTLFSCLCTLDDRHSFVPKWHPPFISSLAAQDRCHLNGMALDEGQPRYVTAMSETDTPQGWRPTKVKSGCLIDVASGEIVVRGLAMPHSPRLSNGRLWVLNSGLGNLSLVDPATGRVEAVEQMPGYTRGLAFHGDFAFVGLSRIRETSTFGGVPIAEKRDELRCGVAVIDLRSGRAVAYVEFKAGIEEIFDVQVVPQARCPHISGPTPEDDEGQAVWIVPGNASVDGPTFRSEQNHMASAGPQTAEQWNEHGGQLMEQARYGDAERAFRRAIELRQDCGAAWANLAFLTADQGETEEARRLYAEAYKYQPSAQLRIVQATVLPPIYRDLAHVDQARETYASQVAALVAAGVQIDPTRVTTPTTFFLAYQGRNDRDLQAQLASLAVSPRARPLPFRRRPGGERIRLGFLSRYLCDHTIGKLNVGLLEHLDRRRFEVVVLSAGAPDDPVAESIRRAVDRFVKVPADIKVALDLVAAQELDILHYPDLGMAPFTFALAHSRLAPVQTVAWGHPETTGLPTIDYFLSCVHGETDAADDHYTERLVRLSRLGTCLDRPRRAETQRDRGYFSLNQSAHVYACPQMLFKFHPEFDEVLAGILRNDPAGMVMILDAKYPQWRQLLERRWSRAMGDVSDRICFLPKMPRNDFLELLAVSDVMLDPLHFGGGHTSYEALSLGLPVVTLPSEFLRGRLTYAMYQRMQFADLIARDKNDYVRLAVELGTNAERRAAASTEILNRCDILFNDVEVVREMEVFWSGCVEAFERPTH